jgi:hypothetical protein
MSAGAAGTAARSSLPRTPRELTGRPLGPCETSSTQRACDQRRLKAWHHALRPHRERPPLARLLHFPPRPCTHPRLPLPARRPGNSCRRSPTSGGTAWTAITTG